MTLIALVLISWLSFEFRSWRPFLKDNPVQYKPEKHRSESIGWLRASVLGANDGIISTASLLTGVAAAGADKQTIFMVGISGLCAGAMSMAAGEYISVSSQADTEASDLETEKTELKNDPRGELWELAKIYENRGISHETALKVAGELMAHDALAAHARDELGINEVSQARPLQAALSSAGSFATGAAVPVITAVLNPGPHAALFVIGSVVVALVLLGFVSAKVSGASYVKSIARIVSGGLFAMGFTTLIGMLTGHRI